jgi:hypothetical protein
MTAPPAFLEPVVAERERTPYEPGNHGPRSEASRLVCLHHLERAHENLSTLSDVVRSLPDDDEVADLVIERLLIELCRAGGELEAFRRLRECAGQG